MSHFVFVFKKILLSILEEVEPKRKGKKRRRCRRRKKEVVAYLGVGHAGQLLAVVLLAGCVGNLLVVALAVLARLIDK